MVAGGEDFRAEEAPMYVQDRYKAPRRALPVPVSQRKVYCGKKTGRVVLYLVSCTMEDENVLAS